jgi:hypothetical protein
LLNAGLRVPLVGASGKDSNGSLLGRMRTYARLRPGDVFAYRPWIEAVRAGRTFVTNGPLLNFQVGGEDPGNVLTLPAATHMVPVRAETRSTSPFDRLEILQNGVVVAEKAAAVFPEVTVLETDVSVERGGWLAARCRGEQPVFHRPANQRIFAHTSPVYLRRDNEPPPVDPAAAALVSQLDRLRNWLHREGRFDNDRQRDHLLQIVESAHRRLIPA